MFFGRGLPCRNLERECFRRADPSRRDHLEAETSIEIFHDRILLAGEIFTDDPLATKLSGQIDPSSATVQGLLLGASANAPLAENLSLYGNVAYGFAREKTDIPDVGRFAVMQDAQGAAFSIIKLNHFA